MATFSVTECDWCGAKSRSSASDRSENRMHRIRVVLGWSLSRLPINEESDVCIRCADRFESKFYDARLNRKPKVQKRGCGHVLVPEGDGAYDLEQPCPFCERNKQCGLAEDRRRRLAEISLFVSDLAVHLGSAVTGEVEIALEAIKKRCALPEPQEASASA